MLTSTSTSEGINASTPPAQPLAPASSEPSSPEPPEPEPEPEPSLPRVSPPSGKRELARVEQLQVEGMHVLVPPYEPMGQSDAAPLEAPQLPEVPPEDVATPPPQDEPVDTDDLDDDEFDAEFGDTTFLDQLRDEDLMQIPDVGAFGPGLHPITSNEPTGASKGLRDPSAPGAYPISNASSLHPHSLAKGQAEKTCDPTPPPF